MKVLVIVPEEKFNNTEFNTVIRYLQLNDFDYHIASTSREKATGYITKEFDNKPLMVIPDLSISEVKIKKYNCLIIIGGSGNKKYLWNNIELHNLIYEAYINDIVLGAICLAPICFINSGIIKDSEITAYKTRETQEIIQRSGNSYTNLEVHIKSKIITANGPKASVRFIKAVLSKLRSLEIETYN